MNNLLKKFVLSFYCVYLTVCRCFAFLGFVKG